MTNDIIEIISVVAQSVAALAAVAALAFIGWQIKQARKTSDLLTLQAFLKDVKDHESALLAASSDDEMEQAFIEILNFLEVYATAINRELIPKVSKVFIRQTLRNSLANIQNAPEWHDKMVEAITSPDTFENLVQFLKDNK